MDTREEGTPPTDVEAPRAPPIIQEPGDEAQYQAVLERLRKPPRPALAALLLILSLGAFVLLEGQRGTALRGVALLVAVLALHEAGHYAAMRAFGYRDVKMFFIPLLGAAVTGHRGDVAAWKEGVMLLLGPAPGIVLGAALALTLHSDSPRWLLDLAWLLLAINGFNLLPVSSLDGGKVLQLALFARSRTIEAAFLVLTSLALIGWAVAQDARALMYVGIFTLVGLKTRYRLLRAADDLRARGVHPPPDPRALDGDVGRHVYVAARAAVDPAYQGREAVVANHVTALIELTHRAIPPWRDALRLVGAWALTVALALGGGALLSRAKHRWAEVSWRSFSSPAAGFAIDLPGAPEQQEQTTPSPAGPIAIRMFNAHAGNGGVASCIVQTFTQPEGYTWSLDESAAALAQYLRTNHGVTVAPPRPATLGDLDAMEVSADFPRDERLRTWVAVDERVKFHVTVTGDRGDVRLQRCADSFRRLR